MIVYGVTIPRKYIVCNHVKCDQLRSFIIRLCFGWRYNDDLTVRISQLNRLIACEHLHSKKKKGSVAAVRSSSPQEDGTKSSFAGVFETTLGVTSLALEAAVRECFASAFDHRVFSYAGRHTPSFAVVVMEMVDARKAGVAFSANPLNSDRDEMLVNSSWGLGESVVDGSVVPGVLGVQLARAPEVRPAMQCIRANPKLRA